MQHLHHDWESPIWRHWLEGLCAQNTLIRYDQRGNGLSDWDVADLSFEAMVSDLESVVDASGIERFALLGISQGCAVSVAYALRHPHRVSHLILYGGYVAGWRVRGDFDEVARRTAMGLLIRRGWGQNNPAFRQMFTSLFIPGANQEQMDWFNELQRRTISPKNAASLHDALGNVDVSHMLPHVDVPTLVLHARDDAAVPFGAGRAFAAGIRGARLVPLESRNHVLLEHEPAFAQFLDETRRFLAVDSAQAAQPRHRARKVGARRA
jgi:pimeloyl-ACP methyl ester carboxylesterase